MFEFLNIEEENYTERSLDFTLKLNPTFKDVKLHWQCRVHNKNYNIDGFGEALSREGATDRAKADCWMKLDNYLENEKKEEHKQKRLKILLLSANPNGLGRVEESAMIHQVKVNVQNERVEMVWLFMISPPVKVEKLLIKSPIMNLMSFISSGM